MSNNTDLESPGARSAESAQAKKLRDAFVSRAWAAPALAVGGFVLLTLLAFSRLPKYTAGTVWAEDGGIFLRDNLARFSLRGLLEPYDGYLHLAPRTLSRVALELGPIDGYGLIVSWLSCACVAGIGVAVYFLSGQILRSRLARALLAVIPVGLPIGPYEALGNLANLHWFILWLVPWLLIYKAKHWWSQAALGLTAFVCAASEIQSAAFLPLLLFRVKSKEAILPALGLLAGVVLQAGAYLQSTRTPATSSPADLGSVAAGWVLHALGASWEPDARAIRAEWQAYGVLPLLVPLVLFLVALVLALRGPRHVRNMAAVFTAASLVFWVAAAVVNHHTYMDYTLLSNADWAAFHYLRYAVAPSMFALGVGAAAVEALATRGKASPRRRDHRGSVLVASLMAVVIALGFFPSSSVREAGPLWSDGIGYARAACLSDPALVTTFAFAAPAGWKYAQIDLPCHLLR